MEHSKKSAQQAQSWFLTYPQCGDVTKEQAYEALKEKGTLEEYVISQELHEDGNPHLHAYVRYSERIRFSATRFDILGLHGNYQVARSRANVLKYVVKHGDYITNTYIAPQKKTKQMVAQQNKLCVERDIKALVDDGDIDFKSVGFIQKAKAIYSLSQTPFRANSTRGIWIYGEPGTGKTTHARTHYGDDIYIKPQNKWWDGYTNQKVVILDDLDTDVLAHYLKIWADKWECTGEIKGGTTSLHHTHFIVTSNYSVRMLFGSKGPEMVQAITRRFRVIKFIAVPGEDSQMIDE